ncbi:hypothetical protein D5S17_25175 [Pseudonocardiaceae bacterium YIM PH 21723]|nr:hypothetical protein D5S17_25175 [Pseudonocardiaceae bacterium YIM PH 21723]
MSHSDVGAYVLGILDDRDSAQFENHLIDCLRCQRELQDLSAMPDVLDGVRLVNGPPLPTPGALVLQHTLADISVARRKRTRTLWASGIAAAALIVLLPLGTAGLMKGPAQSDGNKVPTELVRGETVEATSPIGAKGKVVLEPTNYGTRLTGWFSNMNGPATCQWVVISKKNEAQVAATMYVPPGKTDVPLEIHGAAPFPKSDIARFELRPMTGGSWITIPVS